MILRTKLTRSSGIYVITSSINGKIYIGSASNLLLRKEQHFSKLEKGKHENIHLLNHYNKHGIDSLWFGIIEFCPKEKLIEIEQWYIDNWKPEFNILKIAGSTLGLKWTDEGKERSSKAKTGIKNPAYGIPKTKEMKERISNTLKGRIFSEETRRKISESHKYRKPISEETKRKMSEAGKGRIPWDKGKHLSATHKKKISEGGKGKHHHSDELKQRISNSLKGRIFTPEWKRNISLAFAKKRQEKQKLLTN